MYYEEDGDYAPDATDLVDEYRDRVASMWEYFHEHPEDLLNQHTLSGIFEQIKMINIKLNRIEEKCTPKIGYRVIP